jgi:hypothetical protein
MRISVKKIVITQPFLNSCGAFRRNPNRPARDVTNSIGHTIHHARPSKIAAMMINGHQYDQTTRFARFVFRSTLAKLASSVLTPKPPKMSSPKITSIINCGTIGNHREPRQPRIQRTFSRFTFFPGLS